ncbi:MAG: 16S rRNA (adenine(1518)-N(6)/adenine(1519)-N(6))-dimethyltransferase RsmA [Burkholderiales bacterium]|nr:MAG: 16S rRNA (adenine(1518)-N(6)/adenine(1519)-N(6))-dimethyltransferase RsmA [Burkholderiales bacterium]TAG80596.1 MAG: 16S rRNA (adenine(1518)-N(6)/adenine(1519)-N(6))-dimethyltransferase RsmA [Betaproteobacteria bacterium]
MNSSAKSSQAASQPVSHSSPHRAKKRFGQNFLVDKSYIRRIVDAIDPKPSDRILEIGPGQAALTRELLDAISAHCKEGETASLDVVEIDRDLVARLKTEFTPEQLRIHEGDALEFDFATLPSPLRVVGNLPYNISSPILFRLCDYEDRIADMTFMLQKEVVDRMAAREGEDDRGRLSVMLQYRFDVVKCFDVPPGAFRPIPAVDSSIVQLKPLGEKRLRPKNERTFANIVTAAFTQRRKMIRKSLGAFAPVDAWANLNIDPQARAETLSCEAFVAIADYVATKGA